MSKKYIINFIKVFTFFITIILFLWFTDPSNLLNFLLNQDTALIVDSILLLILSHFVYALRWSLIINFGNDSNNFFKPLLNYLVALFYNSFTPANMGGDIYRIYADSTTINNKTYIIGLVIFERLIGLIIFLGFSTLVFANISEFIINKSELNNILGYILIIFVVTTFFLIIYRRYLVNLLKSMNFINDSFLVVKRSFLNKRLTLISLVISFIGIAICVLAFNILIEANGMSIPFWTLFGIFCAIELIRTIPISYQGFGFREGFFAFCVISLGSWTLENAIYIAGFYYILVSFALALTGFTAFIIKNIISYFKQRMLNDST